MQHRDQALYKAHAPHIAAARARGHRLVVVGNCKGFDPHGGGCPGHAEGSEA